MRLFSWIENYKLIFVIYTSSRSSHSEVTCKKRILKDFAKFPGKLLCRSLFFEKFLASSLQLYKKRDFGPGVCLPVNYAEFLRTLNF